MEEGYHYIHLYTEDWRFAALKTYLKLGYIPYLYVTAHPCHCKPPFDFARSAQGGRSNL